MMPVRNNSGQQFRLPGRWIGQQPQDVVYTLREAGHEVYDFKNPRPGDHGFQWSEIDTDWQKWKAGQFISALNHPIAIAGYALDFNAMLQADACVLVMPCGRSAHIEAGYFVGANKPLFILLSDGEPELMYNMATGVCESIEQVCRMIDARRPVFCKIGGEWQQASQ